MPKDVRSQVYSEVEQVDYFCFTQNLKRKIQFELSFTGAASANVRLNATLLQTHTRKNTGIHYKKKKKKH